MYSWSFQDIDAWFSLQLIKSKYIYGDKAKLLFTDIDSLTYEIEADDVHQDFWQDNDKFNNSDYQEDSPYFNKTNKKVIGKFKEEAAVQVFQWLNSLVWEVKSIFM